MDGQLLLFGALFLFGFIITPALAVYCWFRWWFSKRRSSRKTRISVTALAVASLDLVLGLAAVAISSVRHHAFLSLSGRSPRLYGAGMVFSALALVLSLLGALRSNPLRLKAVLVACGVTLFWFLAGSGL